MNIKYIKNEIRIINPKRTTSANPYEDVKIFISCGMKNRSFDEINDDIERVKKNIFNYFPAIIANDILLVNNYSCDTSKSRYKSEALGEAIKKLSNCKVCFFIKGYENYRGCLVEEAYCKAYGIKRLYEDKEVEDFNAAISAIEDKELE